MKSLFVTSEAAPYISSGYLGDMSASLSFALRQRLIGCRVVMPLYDDIPQELKDNMKFVTSLSVPVSWRRQYCGVFESRCNGVIYYFIDNRYYFKRNGLYGHYDDAERFSFFSRSVLEMLPYIDFKPDIIHSNDWQTALVPVYYSLFYSQNDWYKGIKTIFTIHNIQTQGKYSNEILDEVIGIPHEAFPIMEYDKGVNLMKAAIETAHKVTTISPSYANEIQNRYFSYGLDTILSQRAWKITGILNGIDTFVYDPGTDNQLYGNFTADNLNGKRYCKHSLQKRLNINISDDIPLIAIVTRMIPQKGMDLIKNALNQLLAEENIQVVIIGSGDWEYETFFRETAYSYPGRVSVSFGFTDELVRKIYSGADMLLMPSQTEPCGSAQMIAMRYGTVPIVHEVGGLKDTVSDSGDNVGNGFTFKNYDAMDMITAVRRAIEGYRNRDGWNVLVKRAMSCDFSWGRSANEYIKLYKELINS